MLKAPSSKRLAWVAAALLAVALPGVQSASAATGSPTQMLSSQLPQGTSLKTASLTQTATALRAAVSKDSDLAVRLTEAAIKARESKKSGLSCSQLRFLVDAATSAAPGKSREIVEAAMAMKPECGEELNRSVGAGRVGPQGGILGTVGQNPTDEAQGFGAGLGSGFPGSPGFIGSAPSGAFAFPPVAVASLTPTTGR